MDADGLHAPLDWNFNSTGTANTVHRESVGEYTVTLPGLGTGNGNVQVADYARFQPIPFTAGTERTPTECRSEGWSADGPDMLVFVGCRDLLGHHVDSQFNVTFTKSMGLKGLGGTRVASFLAGSPTSSGYTPARKFQDPAGTTTIYRDGVGRYRALTPAMRKGGAAFVTALSAEKDRCNVSSIGIASNNQVIGVRCRNFNSVPKDASFSLAYLR